MNPAQIILLLTSLKPIIHGLMVLAKIVVKLTPSLKDDQVLADIEKVLSSLGATA